MHVIYVHIAANALIYICIYSMMYIRTKCTNNCYVHIHVYIH